MTTTPAIISILPAAAGQSRARRLQKKICDFGSGGEVGFNDFVAPDQIFASQVSLGNDTAAAATAYERGAVRCRTNTKYKVIEQAPEAGSSQRR